MLDLKKPTISDVADMVRLMAPHMRAERLLPRTPRQVVERLREYWVARAGDELVGVASLALVDFGLAEVGVIAGATPEIERALLSTVLDEARALGVPRAFVLTHDPEPYFDHGFRTTSLDRLPEKRDRQCLHCPRVVTCQQVALELLFYGDPAEAK